MLSRAFINNPGGFLLSHSVARAVPSAPRGLTSVFGMGTGVALSTQPPENFSKERSLVFVLWSLRRLTRVESFNESQRKIKDQNPNIKSNSNEGKSVLV